MLPIIPTIVDWFKILAIFERKGREMRKISIILILMLCIFMMPTPLYAAPSIVSLKINEEIIPGPGSIYLTATATYSDGSSSVLTTGLGWYTSRQDIAEFYGNRLYFKGKGGPLTVSVYKDGVTGIKTLNVKPWPISIDIETMLLESPNPYRLMLKAKLSDGESRYLGVEDGVMWTTSNPWVAWVNNQGVVTFTGEEGYVSITAAVGSLSDSVNTTATGGTETTKWRKGIRIVEDIKYSTAPQKLTLVAVMTDDSEEEIENSSADWSSSNHEVAVIDSAGNISFTGRPGFTTIKVSYGGYHYEKLVSVGRFPAKITINQSLNYATSWDGKTLPLSATVIYNDGSEYSQSSGLKWSVDNKKVAAITTEGMLTFSGEGGKATVSVEIQGSDNTTVEDALTIDVPTIGRPIPQRFFISENPFVTQANLTAKAYCIYSDGSVRDVTEQTTWNTATPDTASVYQGNIYLSPVPGPVRITAFHQGFRDQITAYNYTTNTQSGRVCEIRLKQHGVPFSFKPSKLTAYAIMGDGTIKDVSTQVTWRSSQPLVARVSKGVINWTGRTGKTVITAAGFGYRDTIELEVTPAQLQPQVEKLQIEGELNRAASQLKVKAYYNDGKEVDVTDQAVWNTSNRKRAVVNAQGTVMFLEGLKPVTITASFAGQEASITRE